MPIFLLRLLRVQQRRWILPVAIMVFVFCTSWVLMAIAEPDNDIVAPENYWWWFLITTTTVGYGDFFPQDWGGKLVALYVIFGGITTVALIIAQVSTAIENAKGRRMRGQLAYTGSDHTVILGFTVGRTERLIETMLADDPNRHLVLAAFEDQAGEHPMATEHRVHFLRGDLADEDVLRSTALASAQSVLIDARDDNEFRDDRGRRQRGRPGCAYRCRLARRTPHSHDHSGERSGALHPVARDSNAGRRAAGSGDLRGVRRAHRTRRHQHLLDDRSGQRATDDLR